MTALEARGWLRRYRRQYGNGAAVDLCRMLDDNMMKPDDMTAELLTALTALVNKERGIEVAKKMLRAGEPRTLWLRWVATSLQNRRDKWNDYDRVLTGMK